MKMLLASLTALLLGATFAVADPLHDAAGAGDVEKARQLIAEGAELSAPDDAGEPPLLIAALAGHEDIVALLVEQGADTNVRNKGGLTALHAAAYGGHLAIVRRLMESGADVNQADNFYKMTPLHAAAEEGHTDIVAFLIDRKADIEAGERNGYTPLTQAGWREHWEAAGLLMNAGAQCQPADVVGDWLFTECSKRHQ
ncbi:ankyrin repeat domain-containing protein [Stappia sp. GBMRC 2046]|uniref:Ankyrin repeat domain-containing protein n=1 Tax=Stappia sediminis TaxID=2692190 RepID=A0A7X3S605_9HYPH|nr:ankyrin repeat domain-containing protein [Stappia sediminis]MXN63598.1 ankyrin repeat domain-containing protein [Stappia sediminis]